MVSIFYKLGMMKFLQRLLQLILLLVIITSCENRIEIGEVKDFHILGLDGSRVNCNAEMKIINSSWLPCKVESGEIHALANGNDIGLVKLIKPIKISANSNETYSVDFYLEVKDPEAGIFSLLGNLLGRKPSYELKGNVIARTFIFYRTIEFDKNVTGN
jgi:hypothetical protein